MGKHDKNLMDQWAEENGIKIKGTRVKVRNREGFNMALRTLKRAMVDEGVVKEMRDREFYRSKGEKRRLAKKQMRNRHLRARAEQVAEDWVKNDQV